MDEVVHELSHPPLSTSSIDTKQTVEKWIEKFQQGVLSTSHFKEYWKTWVPRTYSPSLNENCLNWSFNEEEAQRILFNVLETFICNGDPATVLSSLSQLDKPPSVCGRVFKMGEPTYSCRECGTDNTCVLCVDCFKKSDHRFHKYKMGTSCGGGCCDCGDVEAWKKAPFCEIHNVKNNEDEDQSRSKLPEDMVERTRIVFEAVLWYAYNLLTLEYTADLRLRDSDDELFDIDTYCTVLYNDEIHTFEQVINTLNRVIKCQQKNAVEYVTNIDREGRAVVKCSTFSHCSDLKTEIEKYTSRHGNKALKVLVLHAHVVAHQIFSMKLLSWLQMFLGHGEGFRKIFADVALKPQNSDPCIIKGILLRDSLLWKSARTHWHRLLISGMLLEYENKKALAKVFTKNYGSVMKDFIKDDHDHSFSVSSLSVQLFTVPTLAHHLIAYDDALFMLLNTFISECSRKCNSSGKLEFERNVPGITFKRAQYMLYDLRYLLSSVPEVWSDDLRKSFLQGLSVMLNLLTMMQGMDSVTRQVGQHMEFEPEWESAFNLHIKLAYCISLALKWCGTDRVVLVKAYRMTLKKLFENPCYDTNEACQVRELADHSVACLSYDVSSRPVSIHLPLSRFLAGLHLYLEKYALHFDGPEFQTPKPTPVQIIEPVLRTQVMIAQVHAGMWRRNGYALLNQLYFYHNVKCRTEMLDRDVILLQIGASLIESNEFLIHLLNRFNLINWANQNFEENSLKSAEEDSMRQTINLVEEFLQLLIVIIGERYIPGISKTTTEDRIKKEIVQHLCIKPLPHSELNKTIPDDMTHETGLDEVIDELAVFNKPNQLSGKGVYELKENYYNEYNIFFYHYTREELSKSEEAQRKRRKTAGVLECCPPPKLPKLNEPYTMIVNLLQCDVMLHIMNIVLERCINLRARSFSELQLHKILHLIGYALQEEQSKLYPFLLFSEKARKWEIPNKLEQLVSSSRVDAHKDLIKWTLTQFNCVSPTEQHQELPGSSSMDTTTLPEECEKERRAKLAAQKRAKIMAQMTEMQKSFMKENAKLLKESTSELSAKCTESQYDDMEVSEPIEKQPVAIGPNQTTRHKQEKTYVCILCQEEQKAGIGDPTLVLAGFVQQATVLCQYRNNDQLMDIKNHDPLYLNANLGPAPHTSTCGHVMHSTCWEKYFHNVTVKENRRPYRLRHPASFDIDKQEFLCPLCECLSNTVLPIVPPLSVLVKRQEAASRITFDEFLNCSKIVLQRKQKLCHGIYRCDNENCTNMACIFNEKEIVGNIPEPDTLNDCDEKCTVKAHQLYYVLEFGEVEQQMTETVEKFKSLFPDNYPSFQTSFIDMLQLYCQVTYTRGLNVNPHPSDRRLAPMAWKSCAYTIHTIEILLRETNKPLLGELSSRHRDCLESLVRIVAVMGGSLKNNVISCHAIRLLSILIDNPSDGPSILQWDSLGMLISMTFAMPSLFSRKGQAPIAVGGSLDLHILRLIFTSHIIKIFIMLDVNELQDGMETDATEEDDTTVLDILAALNKTKEGFRNYPIWRHVMEASLPFLRCCVLFYHHLTDVPAPQCLLEIGGDTFANMCAYLDLPITPKELFSSSEIGDIVSRWWSHEEVQSYLRLPTEIGTKEPLQVNRLVRLPSDYSELINTVSSFTCPNSDQEDSRNPTMCLVCGEILCSQSYCCQTEVNNTNLGACNFHASKCGAGIGIFLRVRECEVLFLASPHRGCFVTPPYLDDYGETDQGLRRGNPLHLCEERYKKLQMQWLCHSIYEEIARAIESGNHIMATQWNHL